jgi:hypothetical protein
VKVKLAGEKAIVTAGATCTWPAPDTYPAADAVIVADPNATPVTCGCATGDIAPAAITTLDGAMIAIALLLLESATVIPPAGAGADNVIGNGVDWFAPTPVEAGTPMDGGGCTVTAAVAFAIPAALAVIVVDPAPAAVTGTRTAVVFAAIVAVDGTVATAVLPELRLTERALARGADNVSVRF